jgi:small-conductance mechanosensitive channel
VALNAGITAAIVILCGLVIWGLSAGLCYTVGHIPDHDRVAGRKAIRRALRITRGAIALIFMVVAIVMIGAVWGIDIFAWMSAGMASRFAHTLFTLLIVLLITAVAFEVSGLFIGYSLGRLRTRKGLDLRHGAQIDPLGPIIRRTLQAAILIIGIMTFLSQLGVQIARGRRGRHRHRVRRAYKGADHHDAARTLAGGARIPSPHQAGLRCRRNRHRSQRGLSRQLGFIAFL